MNIPILMYHRVCPDGAAPCPWIVTASTFERQLEWLRTRGFRSLDADSLHLTSLMKTRECDKRPCVALTFDDGYLDNFTVAFPLLCKYGFTATIFLVSDVDPRVNFWDRAGPMAGAPLLRAEHVREMAAAGIRFGAHGVTHRRLTSLDDITAVSELSRSKEVLEDLLDKEVRSFAYPYGAVDGRAKALVRRSGYETAFAVNSGPLHPEDDRFEIRRVRVGNSAKDLYMRSKVAGYEKYLRACLS